MVQGSSINCEVFLAKISNISRDKNIFLEGMENSEANVWKIDEFRLETWGMTTEMPKKNRGGVHRGRQDQNFGKKIYLEWEKP